MGFFYSGLRSCLCPGGGSNPGILYAGPTFSPLSQGAGGWPSRFAGFCGGFYGCCREMVLLSGSFVGW